MCTKKLFAKEELLGGHEFSFDKSLLGIDKIWYYKARGLQLSMPNSFCEKLKSCLGSIQNCTKMKV